MKYCRQCGAALPDDTKYCSECGAPLSGTAVRNVETEALPQFDYPVQNTRRRRKKKSASYIKVTDLLTVQRENPGLQKLWCLY